MKSSFECIVCYHKQALRTARLATKDDALIKKVLKATMSYFISQEDWTRTPLDFGFELYPLFYETLGVDDPYKDLKRKSNEHALSLYSWAKKVIEKSSDPLLAAIKFAIAGNIVDYGAMDEFDLEGKLEESLKRDFAINYYNSFLKDIENTSKILYFLDNSGEVVFDKILIETILALYPKVEKVAIVAKRHPIINDIALSDVYELGFWQEEKFELLDNWKDVSWEERFPLFDLVISKGQGNYEGLSSYPGIYFLLVAKCEVVAKDLNVNIGDFIFKLS